MQRPADVYFPHPVRHTPKAKPDICEVGAGSCRGTDRSMSATSVLNGCFRGTRYVSERSNVTLRSRSRPPAFGRAHDEIQSSPECLELGGAADRIEQLWETR